MHVGLGLMIQTPIRVRRETIVVRLVLPLLTIVVQLVCHLLSC